MHKKCVFFSKMHKKCVFFSFYYNSSSYIK